MKKWFLMLGLATCFSTATAQNWDSWRGPNGNGTSDETNLPATLEMDKTLLWSVDIAGDASSTPIVMGKELYLASSVRESKKLLAICLNGETGQTQWVKNPTQANQKWPLNNMASSSPVADETGVWYLFGDGTLVKFNTKGDEVWRRNIVDEYGPLAIKFGFSSSPLLHDGVLYISVLRREKTYRKSDYSGPMDSYLLGVDAATGENRFKVSRGTDAVDESTNAYTSPIVVKIEGKTQILIYGGDYITGHDPKDGKELWRYHYGDISNHLNRLVPSPVADDERVYYVYPRGVKTVALDLVKLSQGIDPVVWTYDIQGPDAGTPLLYKGHLYMIDDVKERTLVCIEAATGEVCWTGQLKQGATYYGSVSGADDKLYLVNQKGLAYVIDANPKTFKILSELQFDEKATSSSISIAGEKIYIRTTEKLYCFGKK